VGVKTMYAYVPPIFKLETAALRPRAPLEFDHFNPELTIASALLYSAELRRLYCTHILAASQPCGLEQSSEATCLPPQSAASTDQHRRPPLAKPRGYAAFNPFKIQSLDHSLDYHACR